MKKETFVFTTSDITEGGMMVALAIILNFLKIPLGPTGGSINLQMLPLFLFSLRKGFFKGFIVSGLVYGAASCFADPYGNLINFPFDYLLAFGSCCVLGFTKIETKNGKFSCKSLIFLVCFILLATLLRLFFSTLSSVVVYEYSWAAAFLYNLVYIPLSGLAAGVILVFLVTVYPSIFIK